LDWLSITSLLADGNEHPIFVLDADGHLQLVNGALERVLGWRREEVVGRRWDQVAGASGDLGWFLGLALRGGLRRWNLVAASRAGELVRLEVSVSPVGGSEDPGLFCEVVAVHPESSAVTWPIQWFEISLADHEFGKIGRVHGAAAVDVVGRSCYQVVAERETPCSTCPLLGSDDAARPVSVSVMTTPRGGLAVMRAIRIDRRRAQVSHELLDPAALPQLIQGRLAALADERQLSQREREVLHFLVLGMSVDEIAAELSISPRTVKFHQANVLDKLGLESRLELIRTLIDPDTCPVRDAR
jgi:PAS domain S-box-containing protein